MPPRSMTAAPRPQPLLLLLALLLPLARPLHAQLAPARIDALVDRHRDAAFAGYRALLRLPNDAHHPDDMHRVLAFLDSAFSARGFATRELPTDGLPLLLAEKRWHTGEVPTVLVYLQADGQPVDPSAWDQEDPYEPVLKERTADGGWRPIPWESLEGDIDPDWRVFARSAADSKGPVAQFLATMAMLDDARIAPDFNLKVIVDAEEELGSPHLPEAVARFRDALAADLLVIFDGPPHVSGRPTLTFGARGIATVTLTTYGPRVPQHSGHYGNYVPNPVFRLAELLASMKDDAGRVTIPGWYDGVALDQQTRAVLAAVPDDEAAIRRELGIASIDSVATSLQQALQYPSLNVRGVRAAWVGDQARTIIPATAVAELDIRLVLETDPERMLRLLREHIEARGYHVIDREPTEQERLRHPRIARLDADVLYAAYRTEFDSPPGRWLTRALTRLHGAPPIRIRTSGGSIPISPFVATLGVPAVTVPTVNPDNNQHSPNENLRVGSFIDGLRTMLAVFGTPLTP
ncbi:MAG: M20/M25/M40 family metallo-hydrolase [Longimicrobiales bacterium]